MDYQKIRGGDLPGEKISVTEGIIPIADRIYTVVKDYIAGAPVWASPQWRPSSEPV